MRLRTRSNVKEIKLKLLGSGGFLDLLSSSRVLAFREWLTQQGIIAHYQVAAFLLDPLAADQAAEAKRSR